MKYKVEYSKTNDTYRVMDGDKIVTDFATKERADAEAKRLNGLQSVKDVDKAQEKKSLKEKIQELSLDQKAKLYFMGLVRQGKIDRLPEDPKAAYVSMMMDKDDYGRSISGKDKRTFMEPEDSMPAARARKLAGMEDDEMETRYDYDDPVFENYTKQSLLKALGNADDALIQTHVSPGEKGEGDYRLDGQEYVIYNPNSNNKDNAAMWNSDDYVVALDKDGEEYEIAYSDIMRINLEETRDEEDEENDRNLALDDIPDSLREMVTELGYLNESKVDISYTDPGFRFYKMKVDGKRLNREEGTEYLKGLGIDMEIPRSYNETTLDKIVAKLKEKGIDADHDAAMDVS